MFQRDISSLINDAIIIITARPKPQDVMVHFIIWHFKLCIVQYVQCTCCLKDTR